MFTTRKKYLVVGTVSTGIGYFVSKLLSFQGEFKIIPEKFNEFLMKVKLDPSARYPISFYHSYNPLLTNISIFASKNLIENNFSGSLNDQFLITNFLLDSDLVLLDSEKCFQNALLASIDSQMGFFASYFFKKKPTATSYLSFTTTPSLIKGQFYSCYTNIQRQDDKNVFLESTVINQSGEQVAKVKSRFVKISGF